MSETRLLRRIHIQAPPGTVFSLLTQWDRLPRWYGRPRWLPRALRSPLLSFWGEFVPSEERLDLDATGEEQIHIRCLPDYEFCYRYGSRKRLLYEFLFQLSPTDKGCELTWEFCCTINRAAGRFLRRRIAPEQIRKSMEKSLDSLRRLAEAASLSDKPADARRFDLPAFELRAREVRQSFS